MNGHLTPFLYCHKLTSFWLLDRTLVDISISPCTDVICNHVYLGTEATVVWNIDPFGFQGGFPGFAGWPRSFLDLRFDRHSYLLLSRDIRS